MTNTHMEEFCSVYNFKSLTKDPTCFKNPEKPTTIDHMLTNHPRCFQHSSVYETGLSDFHRVTLTVLKVYNSKQNPKIIQTEIMRTLLTKISGETFYGSYLFKTFNLMNLINLNLLSQDY